VRPSRNIRREASFRKRNPATFSMMPMQKSSCSAEYSMSPGENSAARISSLSSTVPPSSAASARLSLLFPEPGSPAIRISIGSYTTILDSGEESGWRGGCRQSARGLHRSPGSDRAHHPPTAGGQCGGDRGAPRIRDSGRTLPHDVVFESAKVTGSGGVVGKGDRYRGKPRVRPVHGNLAKGFETVAALGAIGQHCVNQTAVGDRRPRRGTRRVTCAGAKGQKGCCIAALREAGLEGDFRGVNIAYGAYCRGFIGRDLG